MNGADVPSASSMAMRSGSRLWRHHPAVRTGGQLTVGERAADRLRNLMGSWAFVFTALVFLAGWMAMNGGAGFDPFPFILLNLILSCVGALQGAILLIAARRADQVSSELAMHDYQVNQETLALLRMLASRLEGTDDHR
jgi:uncharacterized membrane protein